MSRQAKRLQREADIIAATMKMLEEKGFIDLRMSDVAKVAECSMGVIYSHFSSKEDLLMGCACSVMERQKKTFFHILELDKPAIDRAIMTALMSWLMDNRCPLEYQLRQLVWNPTIWQRASQYRVGVLNDLGDEIESELSRIVQTALEQVWRRPVSLEESFIMHTSMWGLTAGILQLKESGIECIGKLTRADEGQSWYLESLRRSLIGWGISDDGLEGKLETLLQETADVFTEL